MRRVRDIVLRPGMSVRELVEQFEESGGFAARYLGQAARILGEMVRDPECVRFLSFVGAPVSTGLRGVLAELVKRGFFHVVVTTCGTLDHDIARSLGDYLEGDFQMDDEELRAKGYHRVGSVLVPLDSYGPAIERFVQDVLEDAYSRGVREVGSWEVSRMLGERLRDESSILHWAARKDVEVYVPGIMDGAVGTQLWLFQQRRRDFRLNLFRDAERLSEKVFKAVRTGALMVGGGISKHHTLWWNQFKDGLDYAVYITTAVEYDGSLSGAPLREAVSWGKVRPGARKATIYCDATVALPLLAAYLLEL